MRRGDFDTVYRAGNRRSSSHFTVFFRPNELPQSRFGFSIKKALGNAVVRNRMRRRMREVVRKHRQEIPAGWDVVIHPKGTVEHAELPVLAADLLRLLQGATGTTGTQGAIITKDTKGTRSATKPANKPGS